MPAKGQALSQESILRMKANKVKRLRSKYKWELIELYLDVELDISSRNRNKKFIRLREFKKLIEDGNSLKEINKITSKHLVQFYSNLAQGKISLSREDFVKEYAIFPIVLLPLSLLPAIIVKPLISISAFSIIPRFSNTSFIFK